MKNVTLSLLALFLFGFGRPQEISAQVYVGDILLASQSQVNDFPATCNCTTITGSLTITGADIDDLSPLTGLAFVGGNLVLVSNPMLAELGGLAALVQVGGDLRIQSNAVLASLEGLSALASVGGNLWIRSHAALADLDGLAALTQVGGELLIQTNSALTDIDGLAALVSVGGDLRLQFNYLLSYCCGIYELINGLNGKSVAGLTRISANAPGCDREEAVNTVCKITHTPSMAIPGFALHQNMPNPFSEGTLIRFELPEAGEAVLSVYDVQGRLRHEQRGYFDAGRHEIWLGAAGLAPAAGVLSYTLRSGSHSATKRMVMVR